MKTLSIKKPNKYILNIKRGIPPHNGIPLTWTGETAFYWLIFGSERVGHQGRRERGTQKIAMQERRKKEKNKTRHKPDKTLEMVGSKKTTLELRRTQGW